MLNRFNQQLALILFLSSPVVGNASTVVTMQTSMGDFPIDLLDATAPLTVANFLSYANGGAYDSSFIHRSVPGFIIQGGGYTWDTVDN